VLHSRPDVGGTQVLPADARAGGSAVFLGGDLPQLATLLGGGGGTSPRRVRLFAGEAGWSSGQLEAELSRGEWLLAQGSTAWVLGAAAHAPQRRDCLWQRALLALGGEHAAMAALPEGVGQEEAPPFPRFMLRVRL
jgi:putative transcriptional regulator